MRPGLWNIVIIVILVVVIFGGRKLPELGKSLGLGLANFRRAVRDPGQPADKPGADGSGGTEGDRG